MIEWLRNSLAAEYLILFGGLALIGALVFFIIAVGMGTGCLMGVQKFCEP